MLHHVRLDSRVGAWYCICLGSTVLYIEPVLILCINPTALRRVISDIGFAVSGHPFVANIYPVLVSVRHPSFFTSKTWPQTLFPFRNRTNPEVGMASGIVITVLHAVIALL